MGTNRRPTSRPTDAQRRLNGSRTNAERVVRVTPGDVASRYVTDRHAA
ncbi:hypothetical protein AKJ09_03688 [Labilithrix luteola]|uniref:Uncharacterized protein n=1 Tax=Labilithrix luteola TaxID=1391654 RepID=A0A0K1PV67_9BACT|nr:hypothetical protein AKJ09_03688 [Labilithrix luteola]